MKLYRVLKHEGVWKLQKKVTVHVNNVARPAYYTLGHVFDERLADAICDAANSSKDARFK